MQEYQVGHIVCSTAGHDRGFFYIIADVDDTYVYLVDGKHRLVSKPKRKKKKHVSYLGIISQGNVTLATDLEYKRELKRFKMDSQRI